MLIIIIIIILNDISFIFKKIYFKCDTWKKENVLNYVHLYKDVIH